MDAFRVDYFLSMIPKILKLLPETVKVAVFSLALSLVFGLLLAIIRQYRIKGLNFISSVYVSFLGELHLSDNYFCFIMDLPSLVIRLKKCPHLLRLLLL